MNTFQQIIAQYNGYDLDKNGVKEIESLQLFSSPFENPSELLDSGKKLVVVIAESRLFTNLTGSRYTADDLRQRLSTWKSDLLREGRQLKLLEMKAYSGSVHQDGKTLLAIRELFKSIRGSFPNFEGAILVGSFPEASIARSWPQGPDDKGNYKLGAPIDNFAGLPFEIVLADLDGNWRDIYQPKVDITEYIFKVVPGTSVTKQGSVVTLKNAAIETINHHMENVFWIRDENCQVSGSTVTLDMNCRNPEVSTIDSRRINPVAIPDICVSRINARSIAVQPPNPRLLDANGKPQQTQNVPSINFDMESWQRDPKLERTLLVDYFDRNHVFRTGKFSNQGFSISLLESAGLGTYAADEGLDGLNYPRTQVNEANLLNFIRWIKTPALFRVLSSHADCLSTNLVQESDADATLAETEAGGKPWRWIDKNGKYVPSFSGHWTADLYVFRTLWENGQLAGVPSSLLMHVGCDVNGISHPEKPYNDPLYGTFQNASSFLFYGNQLAVLSHAGWWNRGPMGFGASFGASASATFGDGWKGVSEKISQDSQLAQQSTERKQNYIWGMLGDWTLQKYYPAWAYGQKINNGDSTPKALAATVFLNKLFVFWKSNDSGNSIYCSASTDGLTWPNGHKINTGDSTPEAVSVCVFHNKLYVFWKSNDSGNRIYYSASLDGITWPNGKQINKSDSTPKSIGACVFKNNLYVFWKSNDPGNRIYYSASLDGITWPNGKQINNVDSTPEAVNACVFNNRLYLFWKSNDSGNRIYCSGSGDGVAWPNGHRINDFDSTPQVPTACVFNTQLYLFWKANDPGNRIYCSGSSDGITWPGAHRINDVDSTPQPLTSCVFNNQLYLFWKANDQGNGIYYSRNDVGHRI